MVDITEMNNLLAAIQKPLIYLACPYRNTPDKDDVWERVNYVAASLIMQGNILYSPISMTHGIDTHIKIQTDFNFYRDLDEFYIKRCDILAVLKLDDWETSVGIYEEIKIANSLGKPIIFLPDPYSRRRAD